MNNWFMLTVVGKDRPGIVSKVTAALFDGDCNLGEASMLRLGGNFTMMLMVQTQNSEELLLKLIEPVTQSLALHAHVDKIEGELHHHLNPDVRISVFGADRVGIVSQVTGVLAEAGLNILDLESDVGGDEESPLYIMHIEGCAAKGIEPLQSALDTIADQGIETKLTPIDTLIG